jgi:hypothetical protein
MAIFTDHMDVTAAFKIVFEHAAMLSDTTINRALKRFRKLSEEDLQEILDQLGKTTQLTSGDYRPESVSVAAFDRAIQKTGYFRNLGRVQTKKLHLRPGKEPKDHFEIDRIIIGTKRRTKIFGIIGVECKVSGKKIGPPLSQMLDYMNSEWPIEGKYRYLDYCFLWPCEKMGHEIASILAQQRIGTCCLRYPDHNEWHQLQFFCGEKKVQKEWQQITKLSPGTHLGSDTREAAPMSKPPPGEIILHRRTIEHGSKEKKADSKKTET